MLRIIYEKCEEANFNPKLYFKNVYEDEWIIQELSVKMIKDVDKSDVISGIYWEALLNVIDNSIVFIDEGEDFVFTDAFARKIKNTSNYYVLVTREDLPNIPYSVEEIYQIQTSGKYHTLKNIIIHNRTL